MILSLEVSLFASAPRKKIGDLDQLGASVARVLRVALEQAGVEVLRSGVTARPALREEAIAVTPRRYHLRPRGEYRQHQYLLGLCRTRIHVGKYLVDDPKGVTCKRCLYYISQGLFTLPPPKLKEEP